MERHQSSRVRHELRRRTTRVDRIEELSPRMRRIHLRSDELVGFTSPSPDDHVKIIVDGVMRDFTPRRFDAATNTLTIDFALHDAGPVGAWAQRAKPGDVLELGGPKGSRLVPDDFDWYLLAGDETALPAIGRRVEALRAGVPVLTVAAIFDARDEQPFATTAAWQPTWVHRGAPSPADAARLVDAVSGLTLPGGEGFIWIAGEAGIARTLRDHFVQRGHPREWLHASGYWQRDSADTHVDLDR